MIITRIFMNLVLLQNGFPPIFIKEVDKKEYLNKLQSLASLVL
ncbi:hypothetical protein ABIE26_003863 [Pedobacter africanus]|uniref:Uncharacterized protein n=1 Tax=Pedobacter africanus TaxID=151894 RepID=A0ACC6L164_9SPHI|nr:hypothetical protein [Pedobacter africanus]